jgi:hypothetical protein
VPAAPDRRTPPIGASLSRAPYFSRSLPSGADLSAPVSFARALPLSLSRGPGSPVVEPLPRASLFSPSASWASPVSSAFSARRRGPAHAHSRTSSGFSATTPAHAPNSLLIAPPVPRTHPSPHFAHPHPLSRSALAASRRRRPAPAFPTIQLAGVCAKPPRAPPQGETPVPVPNFPYCALCSSNFAFVDARPWRSTALARWPADLARSSSPMLVPKVHLPLLKLAQALARLKSLPRGRNGSLEFLWPARGHLTAALPSLPVDSWPLPRHRVRCGALFPSAQLRRPRSHPSSRQRSASAPATSPPWRGATPPVAICFSPV